MARVEFNPEDCTLVKGQVTSIYLATPKRAPILIDTETPDSWRVSQGNN